jgi:hypothetical protein
MRDLNEAEPISVRVGEAAAHVPEQLRLEKRVADRGAVDRHERSMAPPAARVQQLRREFLSGAALADNQNFRIRSRGRGNLFVEKPRG